MIIYHWSDNHGNLSHLSKFVEENGLPDVFVMTGDFFPNSYAVFLDGKVGEEDFQHAWFLSKVEDLKRILGGKPMMYVWGNHDFFLADRDFFQNHGIDAYQISPQPLYFMGLTWAGSRHIPEIGGHWNGEASDNMLEEITRWITKARPDMLLTHSPPHGMLDLCRSGDRAGIRPLMDAISTGKISPKVHFFGHIHECGGRQEEIEGTLFVNSATTIQKVEI